MSDDPSKNDEPSQQQQPSSQQQDVPESNGAAESSSRHRRSCKIPLDLRLQVATSARDGVESSEGSGGPATCGTIAARPAFTEVQLEETFHTRMEPAEQKEHVKNLREERRVGKETKGKGAIAFGIATKIFPFIKMLMNYKIKEYGPYDLISGLSVGMFLIPQAMAFSLLANVRPQYGFYSAFYAMIIYFIFGSSHHLNMTNQGAVSLLVGEAVRAGMAQVHPNGAGICASVTNNPNATTQFNSTMTTVFTAMSTVASTTASTMYSNSSSVTSASTACMSRDDANARISLTLSVIAGSVQLLLGFLQFGFLTIYLSDPINKAFTCGAAMHVVSGQLGNLLGAPMPAFNGNGKFFLYIIEAFKSIIASKVNVPTILISIGCLILLIGIKIVNERFIKKIKMPIPIDIIVLLLGLLLSKFLSWQETLRVAVIGEIPRGFVPPYAPLTEHFTSGSGIIVDGIVLGIISFAISVSLAKTFALRNGYEVDPNQEMIAYGAVNFISGWFGTFVSAAAITCTSLHESMKGKTLMNTVYACIVLLLAILVFVPEFAPVPRCVLGSIIAANMKNMILQLELLPQLWRTNKYDFVIFIVTLCAILGLDLPIGLLIGVVFSLATVIFRTQAPKAYLLGRLPNTDIYRNIKKHKKAEQIPGLKIFKFDGSLYFANAENYRNRLYRQVGMNPKKILAKAKAKAKAEGRADGTLNLRTDLIRSDGIKQILDIVTEEGSHPMAEARMVAQVTMPVEREPPSAFESMAYRSEDEEIPSSVDVFCIILDMSTCAFTDVVGIRLLTQIVDEFNKIGVEVYLSGCIWLVRSQLRRGNFYKKRSEGGLFVTNHDAVIHALSSLYKELLEDEHLQSQAAELEATTGNTPDSSNVVQLPRPKPTAAERARDTRRHIRKESWRRDSLETGLTPEAPRLSVLAETTVINPGAESLTQSKGQIQSDSVRSSPIPQQAPVGEEPPAYVGHNGSAMMNGGVDNAAFVSETRF